MKKNVKEGMKQLKLLTICIQAYRDKNDFLYFSFSNSLRRDK